MLKRLESYFEFASHLPLRLPRLNLPRAVYWLAALAVVLRLVGRFFYGGVAGFWSTGYYFFFEMAESIAHGRGITQGGPPVGFRVPLYPILLAGVTLGHHSFWSIAIFQSIVGGAIAICAALLACRMFRGSAADKAATLAAAMVAVYPYYVFHDTALQETSVFTLFTLVVVLELDQTARSGRIANGAMAGLMLGLDVLTRATIAPFAALAPLWLLWRRRARAGVVCAVLAAATVAPWILRNWVVMGVPTLSTETGIEFWTGNNGYLFRAYPERISDDSKSEALASLPPQDMKVLLKLQDNKAMADRWFLHKGLEYIRSHPRQTIIDGFRKNAAAFGWMPSPRRGTLHDLADFLSYGPVMVLGLWGMWRRRARWREDSAIYLLFALFMLVTAVFWAQTTHRAHLDVYWMVFGAGALAETVLVRRRHPFSTKSSGSPPLSTSSSGK